jgi:hypothetical protein
MAEPMRTGDGVWVPAELCPRLSQVLWAGVDALTVKAWRSTRQLADVIDLVTATGQDVSARGSDKASSAETPALLSTRSVAAELGVTPRRVAQLVTTKRLRGCRLYADGPWMIERNSVDEYRRTVA